MRSRAQSILEYVIIVGVVAAVVMAMQTYFRRAVNARLEEIRQEYVPKVVPPSVIVSPPSGPPDPIIGTPPSGPPDPIIGTPPSGPPGASPVK